MRLNAPRTYSTILFSLKEVSTRVRQGRTYGALKAEKERRWQWLWQIVKSLRNSLLAQRV
jgi:hypothetical protein